MRVNICGHIFKEPSLRTYLSTYDHRCPVCRHDLRTNIIPSFISTNLNNLEEGTSSVLESSTAEPPPRPPAPPPRQFPIIDLSLNIPQLNFTDLSNNITNLMNSFNEVNTPQFREVINTMSSALLTNLTTAMQNPDNSGNRIAAEYSLLFPSNLTNINNNSRATTPR